MLIHFDHVLSAISGVGLMVGATHFVEGIWPTDPIRELVVHDLRYEDGNVRQTLSNADGAAIIADWTATIWRSGKVDEILCRGSNVPSKPGTYDGVERTYTPDDWTGDTCPTLQPGDYGIGAWTYRNSADIQVTITGTFSVPENL